jgi:hypothetical protein
MRPAYVVPIDPSRQLAAGLAEGAEIEEALFRSAYRWRTDPGLPQTARERRLAGLQVGHHQSDGALAWGRRTSRCCCASRGGAPDCHPERRAGFEPDRPAGNPSRGQRFAPDTSVEWRVGQSDRRAGLEPIAGAACVGPSYGSSTWCFCERQHYRNAC